MPCRASRSWASAIVARTSATPDMTADSDAKWAPISSASSRARLVLPVPGRAPQQERREVAAGDAAPERAALADEVLLADELVEVARAHPGGERLALGRRLEEGLGSGAGRVAGRMAWPAMVARPGGAARRPSAQIGPSPMTWATTHRSEQEQRSSAPPTSAIRRTSRAT